MKSHTLAVRMTLLQQLTGVALIVAFAALAIGISAATLANREAAFLEGAARQVAAALEREWREQGDLAAATHSVLEESTPPGVTVIVYDRVGRRIAATAAAPNLGDRRTRRMPIAPAGFVDVSVSTRPRREALRALAGALLLTSVPLLALWAWVSRLAIRRTLAPLARLAATVDQPASDGAIRTLTVSEDPPEILTLSRALDALLSQVAAMLRAERNFTQDAAHELRTPLTVLSGEIELVLSDPGLAGRHRYGLQRAAEQVRTMSDLVEALLLLRRTDPPASDRSEIGEVNLDDLVHGAVADLMRFHPGRAADITNDVQCSPRIRGSGVLLGAAIRNLLSNAIKFTREGQPVRIGLEDGAGSTVIIVEDGGLGVESEDRERVFDPFYRGAEARAQSEGSGLGLAIIQRVAQVHRGSVTVAESALGGARFELRLPVSGSTAR